MRRSPTLTAVLTAIALGLVGCGQLPNAHVDGQSIAAPRDGVPYDDGYSTDVPTDQQTYDPGNPGPTGTGVPSSGPTATGVPTNRKYVVRGHDRTGVTATTIRFGAHAPVTGAAPLPSRSFEAAADLYWRWITEVKHQKILGRSKIELFFADDRYQPSSATQVCRELGQKVFALSGAGGTDQIQACGRYADAAHIPYTSVGVTERGLTGLKWYFAFSMSYRTQSELLAKYVKRNFGNKKVAAVLTDTPNFDDGVQGWEKGVAAQKLNYFRTFRHPKGDTSWYNTVARDLQNAGVEVLYINTSPVDYIRFAQQANQQGFRPQYVGVGITMALNPVLESGCPDVDGGIFFSPFPGLDWARKNQKDFFEAAAHFGTPQDDLALAIWGQAKGTHETFRRYEATYGTDLTREDFRDFLETQTGIHGGVFPDQNYSPGNHFGARQVHVLKAACSKEEHVTLQSFVSDF